MIIKSVTIVILLISLVVLDWKHISESQPNASLPEQTVVTEQAISDSLETKQVIDAEAASRPSGTKKIRKHVVSAGESLSVIAQQYNIDVETILGANPQVTAAIYPEDELIILPEKAVLHTVEQDETLWGISNKYNCDVQKIIKSNDKKGEGLQVGEKLLIPGAQIGRMLSSVSRAGLGRMIWPVRGEVSSGFGYRWGRLHSGIDIAEDTGIPVGAALSGQVIYAGWYSGYGYLVIIEHSGGYTTWYGHLSDYLVGDGEYVRTGQVVAYVGSTGNSTGPHLHFEVRRYGEPQNPLAFLL